MTLPVPSVPLVKHNLLFEERSLKQHARCVVSFVCLISFCLFNSINSAVAQGTTLSPSKRVVINLGETPWQFIKDSDPANAQAPGFNDSGWQQCTYQAADAHNAQSACHPTR